MAEPRKRRPPNLAPSALGGPRHELQRCMERLRSDLESALEAVLERHGEDVACCTERWTALQDAGFHSAPSDPSEPGRRRISRNLPTSVVVPPNVWPETPKLPPPPQSLTSVDAGMLRRAAEPGFEQSEQSSLSSTRASSHRSELISPAAHVAHLLPGGVGVSPKPPCVDLLPQLTPPGQTTQNQASTRATPGCLSDSDESVVQQPPPSTRRKESKLAAGFSPLSSARRTTVLEPDKPTLKDFVRSPRYELLSATVILLNAAFIVWEAHRRAILAATQVDLNSDEMLFGLAANIFCVLFVLDLALRMHTERGRFFRSSERNWTLFDLFVSVTAVLEAIVHWCTFASSTVSSLRLFLRKFSMLRILRLLRVVRMTRATRVIRFLGELRLMIFSLTGSLKSLAWSVVLILIILLVFGVCFTDGVVTYCLQHSAFGAAHTEEMRRFFGTVTQSSVSLFMAMSGGEDWGNMLAALAPLPLEYSLLFLGFISFTVLALLNVVTAVFVNTALQRSQNDRELVVQKEMEYKEELVSIVEQVFMELDKNHSGSLNIEEFEQHVDDEKIMAYLRSRDIDIGQVRTLFMLLDVDGTGDVSMEEFVNGILRLKGGASSMDLAFLTYQVGWILHNMQELQKLISNQQACSQSSR
eukprot:TRINITY_DN25977_c0_g1_i1.p1 TRINITY_DN25977_c0_g1~~TRINITY_DN25977_c0_g1_i1.p1  ORF type:complete len:642 (+),score=136.17 TRINITY_DN25977_c0_g1_i1:66-1991(+)